MSSAITADREVPAFARDRLAHLWIGVRALSDAGDALWTIALAWTAVQVASPAAAGTIVAAGTIPRAMVLLLGGALADRLNTRRIIITTNVVRVGVLVAVACWVATAQPSVIVLMAAAISFGVCDAIYDPAANTIARQLVRPEDLPSYMGVAQTASRLGTMLGAALGGALVAHTGLAGSASFNAVTFLLVVVFVAGWLVPRFALARSEPERPWRAVVSGFRHLGANPTTRSLVLSLSGLNLAIGPATGLGFALRVKDAGWSATSVGVFEALVAMGAAAGAAAVIRRRPRRQVALSFIALVAQGVAIAVIGVAPQWGVGVACAVIGITAGVASALLSAVFTATVDESYLGRMVSIQRLGDDCLMPLAMAGFGAIMAASTIWAPFVIYGGAMALAMGAMLRKRELIALA